MALTITPIARTNPVPLATGSLQNTTRFAKAQPMAPVATQAAASFTTRAVAADALERATAQKPQGMSDEQWLDIRKNNEAFLQSSRDRKAGTDTLVSVNTKENATLTALSLRQQTSTQSLSTSNSAQGKLLNLFA